MAERRGSGAVAITPTLRRPGWAGGGSGSWRTIRNGPAPGAAVLLSCSGVLVG